MASVIWFLAFFLIPPILLGAIVFIIVDIIRRPKHMYSWFILAGLVAVIFLILSTWF
ncbi:uncharacterized protein HemY [Alkalibacillus filiformis]|uniref:Uncharacterized protein HemY n=1 Tax=Alkalibacillus filiformis TaxID=200990 RepID=A0ABU0DUD3_9BACI|nr:hypothetical protein [Alkalibacillus filiformis]MDQ0352068.1 uncharacterized protein HemY [Alkalibacillus filiformis]